MKAIINAKILDPKLGFIEKGAITFKDGKIINVGGEVEIPIDAEIIDLNNKKYIVPGFIDPHTHQGLFEGGIGWAGADGNEMTDPITPHLRGIDSFNPFEPSIKEVVQGGVTCINTGPGSGNVISGQTLIIKPYGKIVDKMIVKAPAGLKVAFGENPKRAHGKDNKRMPSTRMGIAGLLRTTLNETKNYVREWNIYKKRYIYAKKHDKPLPKPPKKDMKFEVLKRVLKKEIPLHAHAHRADDIATAIRIANEFNIDLVLIHCTEGKKIAHYIAEQQIPAIIGPTLLWTSKPETRERGFDTAIKLIQAGVKIALQTDSLTPMNYFPILPMYLIKEGVDKFEALQCVTINPAEILGIDKQVGSLEPSKDADIVVWSGDPFDFYSKVEKVFIEGEQVYSHQNT